MPFKWKNRLCLIEDGNFVMSAVGDPWDWDFGKEGKESAVAGNPGGRVYAMTPVDENRILLLASNGAFHIEGDPMDGGRIVKLTDKEVEGTVSFSQVSDPNSYDLDPATKAKIEEIAASGPPPDEPVTVSR